MARHRLEVIRPIQPGRGVQRAARPLHQREVLALGNVLAALEHHVLEEVRETGLARLLVLAADVVPQVDGHHRRPLVRREDHAETVVETVALDRNVRHWQVTPSGRNGSLVNRCPWRPRRAGDGMAEGSRRYGSTVAVGAPPDGESAVVDDGDARPLAPAHERGGMALGVVGGGERPGTRTLNLEIKSLLLCQLS